MEKRTFIKTNSTHEEMVDVDVFIPVWMDKKAKEQNINLSEVLQKALISKLNEKDG